MKKLLAIVLLSLLVLTYKCKDTQTPTLNSELHDEKDLPGSEIQILTEEEQRIFEDPNTSDEDREKLVKKYEEALEKLLKEVNEAYDLVKETHADLDMASLGITEDDLKSQYLEKDL